MLCELFCRSVYFPSIVFTSGVFDSEILLTFDSSGDKYGLSLASRCLMGTEAEAHEYGRRGAQRKNERYELEHLGEAIDPIRHPKYYVGFYDLKVKMIEQVAAKLDFYSMTLRWAPENDEDAHFEIQIDEPVVAPSPRNLKNDRKLARQLLALCLMGPYRYIFKDDEAQKALLDAVNLPEIGERPLDCPTT